MARSRSSSAVTLRCTFAFVVACKGGVGDVRVSPRCVLDFQGRPRPKNQGWLLRWVELGLGLR
eukprot:2449060-Pyramimonas_sp.AAC.1